MQVASFEFLHLELSKVLAHLALFVHLHHQVKVALGIFGGRWCVWPDDKLFGAVLIIRSNCSSAADVPCGSPCTTTLLVNNTISARLEAAAHGGGA